MRQRGRGQSKFRMWQKGGPLNVHERGDHTCTFTAEMSLFANAKVHINTS